MINTTDNNEQFLNQINGKIPRSGTIDPETINPRYLFYQCSKHGPYGLFGKLRIKVFNDEPYFRERIKLILSQIQMNTLFKTNVEIKRRTCDKIIHKAMRTPVDTYQKNKNFCATVKPKNACKLEFSDH